MASLCKRSTSKFWVACYTSQTGRQLKRSTKTTDRKEALRIAQEYERGYQRVRTEEQVRRVLFDIHEELSGQRLQSCAAEKFFQQWIDANKATLSARSHAKYAGVSRQFLVSLGPKAKGELILLISADVAAFRDKLANQLSASSANMALKIVRVALGEAVRQGLLLSNPATQVKILAKRFAQLNQRRPFSISELQRLLDQANEEWKGLILFGLYTGQRLGDLARLTWQNLNLERGEISLVTQKTGRRQTLPLSSTLIRHINELPGTDDPRSYLFPNAAAKVAKSKNGETGALSNGFREILESAGLVETRHKDHRKIKQGRQARREVSELSFHCLRHTATSLLKNAGVSDVIAREIIGHDSELVSRNYTHIETASLRKAVELLPDVTGQLKE